MKIGLVNIYSYRPHVEHLSYLTRLLREAGHETYFLTCDASLPKCYSRTLKGSSKFVECSKCMAGGVRSFHSCKNINSISSKQAYGPLSLSELDEITLSSSCTLNRTESELEWNDPIVKSTRESLYQSVEDSYQSTRRWISQKQLDAVICFNGRMEVTRAVTYACEKAGIPFVTHERTWFGDGLTLIPNANCLSLSAMRIMVGDFDEKPLTSHQARLAARLIALRFLQQNTLEWRLYNKDSVTATWPSSSARRRVLVLPSSKNEFAGHKEWESGWPDNTTALDDFFEAFSIRPEDVVVRFHPNWAETIGSVSGARPLQHYTTWAKNRGIYYISSEDNANTYDLIQQADIVVMNGGSSAVEAGACGKQVICLGPSTYDHCGFVRTFIHKEDFYKSGALEDIEPETVIRKTLRFVYLRAKRFPQYVDYVKAKTTTEYEYFQGADPDRLIKMILTGEMQPDDRVYASDESQEKIVVQMVRSKQWTELAQHQPSAPELSFFPVKRLLGLRWLDSVRAMLPRGDR